MIWRLGSRRRLRTTGERGAVLVEAALITPIVALLLFGIIEFGLLLNRELSASNATREGARTGAALPQSGSFTPSVLNSTIDALGGASNKDVTRIVVYEADKDTGYPLTSGLCGTNCNTFNVSNGEASFDNIAQACRARCLYWSPSTASDWAAVRATAPSGNWSTTTQQNGCRPTTATDDRRTRIGVYVELEYDALTPLIGQFLGTSRKVRDHTVIRLEPTQSAPNCS